VEVVVNLAEIEAGDEAGDEAFDMDIGRGLE